MGIVGLGSDSRSVCSILPLLYLLRRCQRSTPKALNTTGEEEIKVGRNPPLQKPSPEPSHPETFEPTKTPPLRRP